MRALILSLLTLLATVAPVQAQRDRLVLPTIERQANDDVARLRAAGGGVTDVNRSRAAIERARQHQVQGRFGDAVTAFEQALALGPVSAADTLAFAATLTRLVPPAHERAQWYYYRALRQAEGQATDTDRATASDALTALALAWEGPLDQPALAEVALERMLALDSRDAALRARLAAVRARIPLQVVRGEMEDAGETARGCVRFNGAVSRARDLRLDAYVRVEPPTPFTLEAVGDRLCLAGLPHGRVYRVILAVGLPADEHQPLARDTMVQLGFGERTASVEFAGKGFILPRHVGDGLPLWTVNVDRIDLRALRIGDRALVGRLGGDGDDDNYYGSAKVLSELQGYHLQSIAEGAGSLVWQGTLEVRGERNQKTRSILPLRQILGDSPRPGVYALTAVSDDARDREYGRLATQWITVSDIGLTSLMGGDGLTLFARGFETALPLAGLRVDLLAGNNEILATVETDRDGVARFGRALLQGKGGMRPKAVFAWGAAGDFVVHNLDQAAFDLSDRGVTGRPAPGPLDPFLYTDRGIYRPGETVHLAGILRDDRVDAVAGLPLTLRVLRPIGTVLTEETVTTNAAGGFARSVALPKTAGHGAWGFAVHTDRRTDPIARIEVQVEDFVPERLKVALRAPGAPLAPDRPATIGLSARFLYGPPAVGLTGEAEVLIVDDPTPFPEWSRYRFGLASDEQAVARAGGDATWTVPIPPTDARGESGFEVALRRLPDSTRPMRADLLVAVQEPGGRPTRAAASLRIADKPLLIGLRSTNDRRPGHGDLVGFEIVTVDGDGARIARPSLAWTLYREVSRYSWSYQNGRYAFRVTSEDHRVDHGVIAVAAGSPTLLERRLPSGRYRLEVSEPAGNAVSSLATSVGWWRQDGPGDSPDDVEVSLDQPVYRVGDVARVAVRAPFAGEATLTVVGDRLHLHRLGRVAAEGAVFELPVDGDWGAGVYVAVAVHRPVDRANQDRPVRALGVAHLALDPTARTLAVALDAPQRVIPRQRFDLPIMVTGGAGQPGRAYVTLAAVDEGILQLTGFRSPAPAAHYLARRRLGIDFRDDYGRLLRSADGVAAALREGGDALGRALPVVPFTVAALFSGIVELDAAGRAVIPLDIPDFAGELRLMAVAYDTKAVGSASRPLTVRDDIVADLTLPRFLAPGDRARATLSLHDAGGDGGPMAVRLTTSGPVTATLPPVGAPFVAGERRSLAIEVAATGVGIGEFALEVARPGGPTVRRDYRLAVQSSRTPETRWVAAEVPAGGVVTLGTEALRDYVPGTASLSLKLSAAPTIDVSGAIKALLRYPFGCLEQTVSQALPLLAVAENGQSLGASARGTTSANRRVVEAIERVLGMQTTDGGFGLWSAYGDTEGWLSAYAMEFLVRARGRGYAVPDYPITEGLKALRQFATTVGDGGGARAADDRRRAARAYAFHALALADAAPPSALRFFADVDGGRLPSALATAQVAAALARIGDRTRAERLFDVAIDQLGRGRERGHWDYGSTLRDAAALTVLLGESGLTQRRLAEITDRLPTRQAFVASSNTQEQAWLVLAAESLRGGAMTLEIGGRPVADVPAPWLLEPTAADLAAGVRVRNAGAGALWQGLSLVGLPTAAAPAARNGLTVRRFFHHRDGTPLNLDRIRQNDVFVMILEGQSATGVAHQAMLHQPLPAGWEIEVTRVDADRAAAMKWIGDLTNIVPDATEYDPDRWEKRARVRAMEGRDDRWAAAVDLPRAATTVRFAFLLRAVTPGSFELPGAVFEDMYDPRFFARQATGRITVAPVD